MSPLNESYDHEAIHCTRGQAFPALFAQCVPVLKEVLKRLKRRFWSIGREKTCANLFQCVWQVVQGVPKRNTSKDFLLEQDDTLAHNGPVAMYAAMAMPEMAYPSWPLNHQETNGHAPYRSIDRPVPRLLRQARRQLMSSGSLPPDMILPGCRAPGCEAGTRVFALRSIAGVPHASAAQLARALEHQRELVAHARP